MKKIYLIDSKIKWSVFKKIHDKVVKHDIKIVGGTKILWQMLKKEEIYCWFENELPNDMRISIKHPIGEIFLIGNPKK